MQCEKCDRDAQVHFTTIEQGEMKTLRLCESCANELGLGSADTAAKEPLTDFLAQLGQDRDEALSGGAPEPCPFCGTTALEFRQSGRLGCSHCYTHFEVQLRKLLRRIHGSTQHEGKVYLNEGSEVGDRLASLSAMRRRLLQAIEKEDFESAADLRDRIQELEEVQ